MDENNEPKECGRKFMKIRTDLKRCKAENWGPLVRSQIYFMGKKKRFARNYYCKLVMRNGKLNRENESLRYGMSFFLFSNELVRIL